MKASRPALIDYEDERQAVVPLAFEQMTGKHVAEISKGS